nr:MAG TPA: hypothetical protein [Caudoviricetes sp.]
MGNRKNGLVAGPFAGRIREIVVGDRGAPDDVRQVVGVQHRGLDLLVEPGGIQGAVMVPGIGAVGLHRQGGRVDAVAPVRASLFQHHEPVRGRCGHRQADRHVQTLGQKIQEEFFDHFSAFRMELVSAFSLRAA